MRRLLVALALAPALVLAQGLTTTPPGGGASRTVLYLPFTLTGGLIPEDAGTVSHVYWNGTNLIDTKGNSWTMNGTVPQVTTSPLYPNGFSAAPKPGAGPFTPTINYSLASPNPLQFASDFTVCAVYMATGSLAANPALAADDNVTTQGWTFYVTSTGGAALYSRSTAVGVNTANLAPLQAPSVACAGRASGVNYVKLNGGATASVTTGYAVASSTAATLGVLGTTQPFPGAIYEFWASTTPWNEANVTKIQQGVLGILGTRGEVATYTRASTATYQPIYSGGAGTMYMAAEGVPRITEYGYLAEGARTNYALQSGTMTTGTAATAPWGLSNATATTGTAGGFLDGVGTWSTVTSTTSIGVLWQNVTVPAATTLVGSAWLKKPSGSGSAGVLMNCNSGTAPACSCVRSDNGVCGVSVQNTNGCYANVSDLGTTPIRLSAIATCSVAVTAPGLSLAAAQYGTSTGTTDFSGAQLEVGTYPTTYVPTTTASVTRNADALSYANPLQVSARKWCSTGVFDPAQRGAWLQGTQYLLSLGTNGGASTAWLSTNYGATYDSTATQLATNVYSAGSVAAHRITFCDRSGIPSVFVDGAQSGAGTLGTGTGIWTTSPSTIYVAAGSIGGNEWGGYAKNLKLCTGATKPSECR